MRLSLLALCSAFEQILLSDNSLREGSVARDVGDSAWECRVLTHPLRVQMMKDEPVFFKAMAHAMNKMTLTEHDTNDWMYFEASKFFDNRTVDWSLSFDFCEADLPGVVAAFEPVVARMHRDEESETQVSLFIAHCVAIATHMSPNMLPYFQFPVISLFKELHNPEPSLSENSEDSEDASERLVRDLLNEVEKSENKLSIPGADPRLKDVLARLEKAMYSPELLIAVARAWFGPLLRAMPAADSYAAAGERIDAARLAPRLGEVYGRVKQVVYTGDVALLAALVDRVLAALGGPGEQEWSVLGWQHLRQVLALKTDVTHFPEFVAHMQQLVGRLDVPDDLKDDQLGEFTETVAIGADIAALAARQFEVPRALLQPLVAAYESLLTCDASSALERGVAALRDVAEQAPAYDDPTPAVRGVAELTAAQYDAAVGDVETYLAGTEARMAEAIDRLGALDGASGLYADALAYTYAHPFVEAVGAGSQQLTKKAVMSVDSSLRRRYLSSYKKLTRLAQQKNADVDPLLEHLAVFK